MQSSPIPRDLVDSRNPRKQKARPFLRKFICSMASACMALLVPELASSTPTCSSAAPVIATVATTASTQRVFAFGVANATQVTFQTWWTGGSHPPAAQGVSAGSGMWYYDVPLNQYDAGNPRYGSFETDVYMFDGTVNVLCAATTWTRSAPATLPNFILPAYYYDADGRLVDYLPKTTFSGGTIYDFGYDALGNLNNLVSLSASGGSTGVQVRDFFPTQGAVGASVQIHGFGFSGAPTVTFNGVPAVSVTAVTLTDLVAIVPAGASTGPISVTAPFGTAASNKNFTVLAGTASPTGAQPLISGVGNSAGVATVSGSNLYPIPSQTVVRVGPTQVVPTSITNTQIQFSVPSNQASDFVYVTTPYGTAKSALALSITSPFPVTSTVALTPGVPGTLTLPAPAPTNCGAFTLPGSALSWMSLQLASVPNGATVNYMLFGPDYQPVSTLDNSQFNAKSTPVSVCNVSSQLYRAFQGSVSSTSLSIHFPPLPTTGQYTLLVSTSSAMNLTATVSTNLTVQGGSSTTVPIAANQTQRVQLVGTQAQAYVLDVSNQNPTPPGLAMTATGLSPYAVPLDAVPRNVPAGSSTNFISGANATPYGGVLLGAASGVTGTFLLGFNTTLAGNVVLDAAPISFNQTLSGHTTRFSMPLTASQPVTLALTTLTPSAVGSIALTILDPYGNTWSTQNCSYSTASGNCSWDFDNAFNPTPTLSGTYVIVLAPTSGSTYTGKLSLASDIVVSNWQQQQTVGVSLTALPGKTEQLTFTSTQQVPNPVLITVSVPSASPASDYVWGKITFPAGPATDLKQTSYAATIGSVTTLAQFWSPVDANKQISLKLGVDNSTGGFLIGQGTGATGSANVYLTNSVKAVTVNNSNSTSISTTTSGQGVQVQYAQLRNAPVVLKFSQLSKDLQAVVYYAIDSAGTQWDMSAGYYSFAISKTLLNYPFSIPQNSHGNSAPTMLVLYPYSTGQAPGTPYPGDWLQLPTSGAGTFSGTLTLTQ